MKKFFLIIIIALFGLQISFSQELLMESELVESPDAFGPKFNGGGTEKFYEFINKEFDFSKVLKAGRMIFSFIISENGDLKNIKVIEFPNIEAASEIIRVLDKSPKWEPAKRAGKPFSTEVKMPITFKSKKVPNVKIQNLNVENAKDTVINTNKKTAIEIGPKFSGGMKAFLAFISKNYNVPVVAGLKGKVEVSFIIEKDGSLVDIKVLKDIGHGTGDEAIRVLKLSPKWSPGYQNGKPVRCIYKLPITIKSNL